MIRVTTCVNNTTVMLQPFDVTNADKSKHKFMVQSMFPPPGEVKLEEIVRNMLHRRTCGVYSGCLWY